MPSACCVSSTARKRRRNSSGGCRQRRTWTSFSAHMGVLGSPYRKQLLPLMEQRLVAADQPVWERYLDTLADLAELVSSGGTMPPYPKDASGQKAWQDESKRRADVREQKLKQYAERLIASLPAKQSEARAVSLNTLLSLATRDLHGAGAPFWWALSRLIGSRPASLRPYSGFFNSSRTRVVIPSFRATARASRRTRRNMASGGCRPARSSACGAPCRPASLRRGLLFFDFFRRPRRPPGVDVQCPFGKPA